MSISPAGNHIAFIGTKNGTRQLYVRALDSPEAMPMAGTERAYCTPIFSPDGQWVAYFDQGTSELKKIPIQGGAPVPVTLAKAGIYGAAWGADDTIIYSDPAGLKRISAGGGTPESITQVDVTKGETGHRWPAFLPGSKVFVFAIEKGKSPDDAQILSQRLDTGERRLLIQGGTFPQYVPAGYLVYVNGGRLMAVPFDVGRLQVKGQAVAVDESVQEASTGAAEFGLSPQGSLVYVSPTTAQKAQRRLLWVSRNGTEQPLASHAQNYNRVRLSPDGRRAALELDGQIWMYDLSRDTLTRFTFEENAHNPVWSPDGKRIAFASDKALLSQLADGSGGLEQLTTGDTPVSCSWSPDGQLLAFQAVGISTGRDIWVLRLSDRKAQPFLRTPFNESAAQFSPDGRWLAYVSDESGRSEIYVQPYPGPGGKWQISTEGGIEPIWNRSGIYYRNENKMMAVEVTAQPSFSAGKPHVLFEGQYMRMSQSNAVYDVSPDGQRFLMGKESEAQNNEINVVLNWFEELNRRLRT